MLNKLTPGDTFELKTLDKKYVYFQFILSDLEYGDLTRVLDGKFKSKLNKHNLQELVNKKEINFIFTNLKTKYKSIGAIKVGNFEVPPSANSIPKMRNPGLYSANTKISKNWSVWDGSKRITVGLLNEEIKSLPIEAFTSIELFKKRVETQMTPEDYPVK